MARLSGFRIALILAASFTTAANAAVIQTLTTTNVASNGGSFGSSAAGKYTYTVSGLTGSYTLDTITFGATVERVASADAAGEKRVGVTVGSTSTSGFNPGFPSYAGTPARSTVSNVNWDITNAVISNGSVLTFQFYESINDGGDSAIDANYNSISLALNGTPYVVTAPTVPAANQFGALTGNNITRSKSDSIFSNGQVNWYSFTIDRSVNGTNGYRYLDLDTSPPSSTALDTELALFDADGKLIANDDEDGSGSKSALSFGAGSNTRQGDSGAALSDGRDGATLPAGTYYVAVAPFNASFADGFQVTGNGSSSGGYSMNITLGNVVPEPTTLASISLAALAMHRRRR